MNRRERICLSLLPLYLLLASAATGCGNLAPNAPLGATAGGAQDIGYARNMIEAGEIPPADYIVPEGLFSEHDIATPSKECADELCLSLGYALATAVDDESHDLFVHLGLTSSITPETFQRPDLQLALVVDRSGSMHGEGIAAVREALRSLLPKLTDRDFVSLFQFDDEVEKLLGIRRMDAAGRRALEEAIDRIEVRGGTNIESGVTAGYEELDRLETIPGVSRRLMLFTDARPNVGMTGPDGFREITATYADRGIGLTAFGVGVDFGQELVYHISRLRGGNFFFLRNAERIRSVFTEEFDLLVTPIVYDLLSTIPTPPGSRLKGIYGLPDQNPMQQEVTLSIPTVFFSKNRGAIILRYTKVDGEYAISSGEEVAGGTIRYVAGDRREVVAEEKARHAGAAIGPEEDYFTGEGTRLGVALTNVYLGLHGACRLYHGKDRDAALALLDRTIATVTAENRVLANDGLATELALLGMLRENIVAQ